MGAVIRLDELLSGHHWFKKIDIGTRVSLQFLDQRDTRIRAELLGFRIGHYILIRYEDSNTLPVNLTGYVAIVRFLIEDMVGECLAFKSEIIQSINRPDRILYCSFPEEIHRRSLRHQKRQITRIPATIRVKSNNGKKQAYEGFVVDISAGGCRFIFKSQDKSRSVKQLPVIITLAGQDQILGMVRSARNESEGISIGIQFDEPQVAIEQKHSGLISEMKSAPEDTDENIT
ncbi:MAG: PilZ domain-containing protein [Idiomarina sp.]|nr:PilZ domain-containing protein [Idiomarina sp.]